MLFQTQVVHDCTQHPRRLSVSKDASCQTSDCEVIPSRIKSESRRSTSTEGRRKVYGDHRRATESLVSSRGRSEGRLLTVFFEIIILKKQFENFFVLAFTDTTPAITSHVQQFPSIFKRQEKTATNCSHWCLLHRIGARHIKQQQFIVSEHRRWFRKSHGTNDCDRARRHAFEASENRWKRSIAEKVGNGRRKNW